MFTNCIWILFTIYYVVRSEMEPYIVGGDDANIEDFPYSAFLAITCVKRSDTKNHYGCGGSILTQKLILTAAHCLAYCEKRSSVLVTVGHENRKSGKSSSVHSYILHEKYEPERPEGDIALVRLKTPLSFNKRVSRVALMRNPPYGEEAKVAGWGLVNESFEQSSDFLKYIVQIVWPRDRCIDQIRLLPNGTFCASAKIKDDFASRGDSGSALVVRDYIQIGLVSYKMPTLANNIIVYTDVGRYYEWIEEKSKFLMCN